MQKIDPRYLSGQLPPEGLSKIHKKRGIFFQKHPDFYKSIKRGLFPWTKSTGSFKKGKNFITYRIPLKGLIIMVIYHIQVEKAYSNYSNYKKREFFPLVVVYLLSALGKDYNRL